MFAIWLVGAALTAWVVFDNPFKWISFEDDSLSIKLLAICIWPILWSFCALFGLWVWAHMSDKEE